MESEQKKSKVGMIVMWIVVLAIVGVFVVPKIIHPPPDRFRDNQKDPENALKIYLETAYGFLQIREGCGFMEMEKVVTAGDWQWYNDNWQTLFHDDFNLKSGANPGDAAAIGKRMALNEILEGGACSPSNEVIQKDIHDTEAVFVVRAKDVESRSQTDFKVHVVKEGRYWKVQGFAGG
ncbi:hypothetical protein HY256_12155, partial [Candidatus Sumerlaeota bacterium]|nr:hypothetical protein [Candidatus Sumerlaeota bacterium]